jgi:hypothetical protein
MAGARMVEALTKGEHKKFVADLAAQRILTSWKGLSTGQETAKFNRKRREIPRHGGQAPLRKPTTSPPDGGKQE